MKYYRTERIYEAIGWPEYQKGLVSSRAAWIANAVKLANGVRLQATYRPDQSGRDMLNNRRDVDLDFLLATPALVEYVNQHINLKPQYLTSTQRDVLCSRP